MLTDEKAVAAAKTLLPQHEELIRASAICPEVAATRGYWSAQRKTELKQLGFGERQCIVPALVVPVWTVTGDIGTYQIRPDQPRISHDGKPIKYETPGKSRMVLDVHPSIREQVRDPSIPLFITEGIRKADAPISAGLCCVALLGVWNFRGTNEFGGKTALADWECIALNGRQVYIVFDSDVMLKPQVHQALARLKAFLEQRGAQVSVIYLPPGPAGEKTGLDDYLAAGHDVADLLALASNELRGVEKEPDGTQAGPYQETEAGLVWVKPTRDGEAATLLTNFTARIAGQVLEDDGAESRRLMEIEAKLRGRTSRFCVTASEFGGMNWPLVRLGAGAVVHAGFGLKEHARVAIQSLSGDPAERIVFTHTGWRQIGGVWCYLHGGGAIGPDGAVEGVSVELPGGLGSYALPAPPEGDRLKEAVRASLALLDLAPDMVTVPLFCAIWRSTMGGCDLSIHEMGATGVGKTELAALAQQHWGPGMDARHLPGNWSSTDNALELLAFHAKDAILVVDDYAPSGTAAEQAQLHRKADRLLRAQGNRSGRQRLRSDATPRPPKPPRGLIVSTGEDVPRGESLRARIMVLDVSPGDLDWGRLSMCKQVAAAGRYAEAMAGYLQWLAGQHEQATAGISALQAEFLELRQSATGRGLHKRIPGMVADLAIGLRYFLTFAQHAGAVSKEDAEALWRRGWRALQQAAAAHSAHQSSAHPAPLFLRLLVAAVASGRAHLAGPDGGLPESPGSWGWQEERGEWRPRGHLVGWLSGRDVYLEPDSAYAAAQSLGQTTGETIAVTPRVLHKRLNERKLLASTDVARGTLTVRKTLAGSRRDVLHVHAQLLPSCQESDQSDQTDHDGTGEPLLDDDGQIPGQFPALGPEETDHANCPQEPSGGDAEARVVSLGSLVRSSEQEIPIAVAAVAASVPAVVVTPLNPCYACKGRRFWHDQDGNRKCATCHPPTDESMVAEWASSNGDEGPGAVADGPVPEALP